MKIKIYLVLFIFTFSVFNHSQLVSARTNETENDVRSAFSTEANGRLLISKNYDYRKKNVAILIEWRPTFEQVLFQQILSQEFMANGYTVVERLQFDQILRELALDQTGAVNQKSQGEKEIDKEFTKKDLKKLGELLGISHIIYFRVIDDEFTFLRFVNLETAEIEVNAFINAKRETIKNRIIIKSIIKAIVASQKMEASNKDLIISFVGKLPPTIDKKRIVYQDADITAYINQ